MHCLLSADIHSNCYMENLVITTITYNNCRFGFMPDSFIFHYVHVIKNLIFFVTNRAYSDNDQYINL